MVVLKKSGTYAKMLTGKRLVEQQSTLKHTEAKHTEAKQSKDAVHMEINEVVDVKNEKVRAVKDAEKNTDDGDKNAEEDAEKNAENAENAENAKNAENAENADDRDKNVEEDEEDVDEEDVDEEDVDEEDVDEEEDAENAENAENAKEEDAEEENAKEEDAEEEDAEDAGSGIDALDADLETWERIEEEYGVFQREPVDFIHYHFIYMGREDSGYYVRDVRSKILELVEEVAQLESSVLMSLIKNNEIHNNKRYKVYKMLRYNVTATLADVEAAVRARGEELPPSADAATYITELEGFPTIAYEDTMVELEEHNALLVFMVEDVAAKGAHRRRSRGHPKPARRSTTRRGVTRIV